MVLIFHGLTHCLLILRFFSARYFLFNQLFVVNDYETEELDIFAVEVGKG